MANHEKKIIPFRAGYSNIVLIANGRRSVLVDTGARQQPARLKVLFDRQGLQPSLPDRGYTPDLFRAWENLSGRHMLHRRPTPPTL